MCGRPETLVWSGRLTSALAAMTWEVMTHLRKCPNCHNYVSESVLIKTNSFLMLGGCNPDWGRQDTLVISFAHRKNGCSLIARVFGLVAMTKKTKRWGKKKHICRVVVGKKSEEHRSSTVVNSSSTKMRCYKRWKWRTLRHRSKTFIKKIFTGIFLHFFFSLQRN